MAYGLQVFDSSSNIVLDTGDRITRLLATYSGTLNYGNGDNVWTISIPGFLNDNGSYLLVNTSLFCDVYCTSSETVILRYYSYYSSGSITYTVYHMGF